jgi:hydrogenase expression/formation protein HypC
MCLAIPGQIREIDGVRARVEMQGNFITADLSLVDDPAPGDWVLVHAGFAIEKLDPEEARETLALFDSREA